MSVLGLVAAFVAVVAVVLAVGPRQLDIVVPLAGARAFDACSSLLSTRTNAARAKSRSLSRALSPHDTD